MDVSARDHTHRARRPRRASIILLASLAACSGRKPKATEDDAKHATTSPSDAAARASTAADATAAHPAITTGDIQVRVEWQNVPASVRASPGTTPCGTPRAPAVAPSTTWGIGDVFVIADGAPLPGQATLRLADCAFTPRVAVGTTLALDSAADRPVRVTLTHRGDLAHLDALTTATTATTASAGTPITVQLPIAGHTVTTVLDMSGIYELATDAKDPETAWILAAHAAITDPNGGVLLKDIPPGKRTIQAWLPPRGGQPARHASGEVTVVAGDLAELTLKL